MGRRLRRAGWTLAALVSAATVYLVVTPSRIDPIAWQPEEAPELVGPLAPNTELRAAEVLGAGEIPGPEDVDIDGEGRVYGAAADGRILRVGLDGTVETFAETGGRPLGLHFDAAGNLIVADSGKGLLSIDPTGAVTTLTTEAGGVPFAFTDDLDIARDGRIYFSDASDKFGQDDYMLDLLEGRPHGRLLRYDPSTGDTEVLLDELHFANGVALSAAEDFVLVNETYRLRITRLWLEGPTAGASEVFADNLPGFPDGVSRGQDGRFWVAFFTVRNPIGDVLAPRPWARTIVAKLPRVLWPKPARYGFVVAYDEHGSAVRSLHDPEGEHVFNVTSAQEHAGKLYLGSLHDDKIAVVSLSGGS